MHINLNAMGTRMKRRRKELKMSQAELAEKLASGMIPEQKNKKSEETDAQKKLLEWEQEYRTRRRQ